MLVNFGHIRLQDVKVAFEQYDVRTFWALWEEIGLHDNELVFYLQLYFCFSIAAKGD